MFYRDILFHRHQEILVKSHHCTHNHHIFEIQIPVLHICNFYVCSYQLWKYWGVADRIQILLNWTPNISKTRNFRKKICIRLYVSTKRYFVFRHFPFTLVKNGWNLLNFVEVISISVKIFFPVVEHSQVAGTFSDFS